MKEITVWKKLNNTTKIFEHNHIEDGHMNGDKPIGKYPNQTKGWSSETWYKIFAFLDENNKIIVK